VLLHHGIPAVIAMRDSIADEEALSFIQVLAQGLADRQPIERAMAIARQHLLTVYQFNQPAWSLPVLYLHPQFDGNLLRPAYQAVTQIPDQGEPAAPVAVMRRVDRPGSSWPLRGGVMRVGRLPDNDLVIMEPWVSGQHAEIFCRSGTSGGMAHGSRYYLRDNSRNGSYYYNGEVWQHVHRAEVPHSSGNSAALWELRRSTDGIYPCREARLQRQKLKLSGSLCHSMRNQLHLGCSHQCRS
jgi:hypothetical protein